MKLQFNLLPDVKQQYLKTKRTKRTIVTAAVVSSSIALFILLFTMVNVYVINKKQLSDADNKIDDYSKQLQNIPDLNNILTVQNQLKQLASLHQSKHEVSRIYTFLPQVTPTKVHMGGLNMDLVANTMQIKGTADTQKTINTFIDTLKFTTYKVNGQETGKKAFPSVIEQSFGITKEGASYELSIQFDPALFSNAQEIDLTVPEGLSTTRSVLNDPSNALFDGKQGDTSEDTSGDTSGSGGQQ